MSDKKVAALADEIERVARILDSYLPLPSVAQDMSLRDYDLYIELAQLFGPMRNALAALRREPVQGIRALVNAALTDEVIDRLDGEANEAGQGLHAFDSSDYWSKWRSGIADALEAANRSAP